MHRVLINGSWREANSDRSFHATNPQTATAIDDEFPVSTWTDCETALNAAVSAFEKLRSVAASNVAEFVERYADRIEARAAEICELANLETGLPVKPRLLDVELPRTTNQLRLAAATAREASWCRPTIDTTTSIRSIYAAIGPVAVFGPNNFPFAFGSISGGDFAAAIAAGNPVIAKANSSHPGTTRLLAEEAQLAAVDCSMPAGMVQLIYRIDHADGEKLVSDQRLAAVAYTGSRSAGLRLKSAADAVGKPIYLELSSINPVVILPGAIAEKGDDIAADLSGSCLLGTGQFCTSPGLVIVLDDSQTDEFIKKLTDQLSSADNGVLLSESVLGSLGQAVQQLTAAGAEILCGGSLDDGDGFRFANTLLRIDGDRFLDNVSTFQTEAFGNALLIVVVKDTNQACSVAKTLEGNLTGTLYTHSGNDDDEAYDAIEPILRQRVGRLLNDYMPTGVAVSPAMNHGGPFPATGHPGFTAVGLPASMFRFSMLQCFDNVRPDRLPVDLRDENPNGILRNVDGKWTREPLAIPVEFG